MRFHGFILPITLYAAYEIYCMWTVPIELSSRLYVLQILIQKTSISIKEQNKEKAFQICHDGLDSEQSYL